MADKVMKPPAAVSRPGIKNVKETRRGVRIEGPTHKSGQYNPYTRNQKK